MADSAFGWRPRALGCGTEWVAEPQNARKSLALIKCYECEKEISDKAPACPHCGAPKEEQPPELEEAEILESVAVVDEPEPITQETVSAPSTEPEPVATKDEGFNKVVAIAVGAIGIPDRSFLGE